MLKKYIYYVPVVFLFLFSCQPINVVKVEDKSNSAYLQTLTLNNELLTNFSSDVFEYTLYWDAAKLTDGTVSINAKATDEKATLTGVVNGAVLKLNTINKFTVGVFSEDTTVANFYTINIYYYNNDCLLLKNILVNGENLSSFNPEVKENNITTYSDSVIIKSIPMNPSVTVTPELTTLTFSDTVTSISQDITVSNGTINSVYNIIVTKKNQSGSCYNSVDLSYELQRDGFRTVIAGDSISVGYGFVGTGGTNPTNNNNAWDTYPGIQSWSQMIRDAIHRNDPYFIHADQLQIGCKYSTTNFIKSSSGNPVYYSYFMPFNNRNVAIVNINQSDNEEIVISVPNYNLTYNKLYLWFSKTPANVGCSFDIYLNGTKVKEDLDLFSTDISYYQGYETVVVPIENLVSGNNKITFNDFKNTAGGTSCGFFINGISTKYSPVYLTGRSASTSEFWADIDVENGAFNKRIAKYSPDLFIFLMGTNDCFASNGLWSNGTDDNGLETGTVAVTKYEENMKLILSKVKEINPNCHILLVAPPVWSSLDDNAADFEARKLKLEPYTDVIKKLVSDNGYMFLDIASLFSNIPYTSVANSADRDWRADYVHLTPYGNTLVAKNLYNMFMPNSIGPIDMVDADRVYNESNNYFIPEHGWTIVKYNAVNQNFDTVLDIGGSVRVYNYSRNYIKSVYRSTNESVLRIDHFMSDVFGMPKISVEQFGASTTEYYSRIESFWDTHQRYFLYKNNLNAGYSLTDDDFKALSDSNIQFLISW